MSFAPYEIIITAARQHQEGLMKEADELRRIRRANRRRLDYWKRPAQPHAPDAA